MTAGWADFLETSPLAGLALVLGTYHLATRLQRRAGGNPVLNPVLVAGALTTAVLFTGALSEAGFRKGGDLILFLLGPATVALAVPLVDRLREVRRNLGPVLAAVSAGAVASAVTAVGVSWLLGASRTSVLSMAPKTVTTPIALGISESIGGDPSRTVLFVVATGVFGAVAGTGFLRLLRVRDPRAVGLALGTAAHGVGTSRAVALGPAAAAFAGLGMGLCGLLTALLLPWIARLF